MFHSKFSTESDVRVMNSLHNEMQVEAKKARITIEKKKCMKMWYHDWTLITGCTKKADPDGHEEKEWCKV